MRKAFSVFLLTMCVGSWALVAQPPAASCTNTIQGKVTDRHDGMPLPFATLYVEETSTGVVTDSTGAFRITNVCPGGIHILVRHLGCEPLRQFIQITGDTTINFELEHHAAFLEEVEVEGNRERSELHVQESLAEEEVLFQSGEALSDMLDGLAGVSTIKNGSAIAKPVIQGMSGNRVVVLNNGIVQAGQQWGADHAPEIDPFTAGQIKVVKGVDAIAYGGNGLGGMIITAPPAIAIDPHVHGSAFYRFTSNGRGHVVSSSLQRGGKALQWRITGTLKQNGDRHAPDYYLTNTGNREANAALQLSKRIGEKWLHEAYYSYFSTEIGILRGSHIGNLSDLQSAIERDEPWFTSNDFSYTINEPRQEVIHQLWKYKGNFFFSDKSRLTLIYSGQWNQRKEFDVRRGNRSSLPALDLDLEAHSVELVYARKQLSGIAFKSGIQLKQNTNYNDPQTGILPLIPNYTLTQPSLFALASSSKNKWKTEWGGRIELPNYEVDKISNTRPYTVLHKSHHFVNYSLASGLRYTHNVRYTSGINVGFTARSPEINELYSFGLHQGVSGIEEGNDKLKTEQSLKLIWYNQYHLSERFLLKADLYHQYITNYIFLEPQDEYRLTIRGAFPVFLYKQSDVTISGLDLTTSYQLTDHWNTSLTYTVVRGNDIENNTPLVYMPADRLGARLLYNSKPQRKIGKVEAGLIGEYVFEQHRLEADQDFLAPPPAYFLLGLRGAIHLSAKKQHYTLFFQADNVLNMSYRDYLDRLRYYSDAAGFSLNVGVKYTF
jgi:iron complex outermembrane receptor protein